MPYEMSTYDLDKSLNCLVDLGKSAKLSDDVEDCSVTI